MSHYTVLVVGEDAEEQLAPFNEQDEEFMEFEDEEDAYLEEYKTKTVEAVKLRDGRLVTKYCKEVESCWKRDGFGISNKDEFLPPVGAEILPDTPVSKIYSTFEFYMKEYNGMDRDEKHGRYGHSSNDKAKWDWYSLGGRWTGFFKLKPKCGGALGRSGVFDNKPKSGHVDSCLVKDIDFDGMRDDAGNEAGEKYDNYKRLCGGVIPVLEFTWAGLRAEEDLKPKDQQDYDALRNKYHGQHAKKIVQIASERKDISKGERDLLVWADLQHFQCTREEFVKRARNRAISTFAVLMDGEWYEQGEMGWFGCSTDKMTEDEWQDKFAALIDGLPGDTLVSVYDCHI